MRIDEIFNFEKGVLQSSKCVPGEYLFITASSEWKTHNEYTHNCEALVFAAAASGSLGRTHYVNGKFVSSDLCFIITPKDQINFPVDLKFYHILFNELKDEIVRNTKAGTSKEAIGLGSFGKYELPYLHLDSQIEIKNRFVNSEETNEGISTELRYQLSLVKKLRYQLLKDAVQGKLVEQNKKEEPASELLKKIKAEKGKLVAEKKLKKEKELPSIKMEEIPFDIPKSWVWCRLGEICDTRLGKMLDGVKNKGEFHPYLRNLNVRWYEFNLEDVLEMKFEKKELDEYSVKRGDLLICEGGYPGRAAIWNSDDESFKFQKALHRVRFYQDISSKLYLFYLDSICFSGNIKNYCTGAGIQHLTGRSLKQMPVPLPPFAEQNRIIQKLEQLILYCNDLEESIKQSGSQNEKLLQQVLREALRKEPVEI
jgi:type I restriction enzyme S subunit